MKKFTASIVITLLLIVISNYVPVVLMYVFYFMIGVSVFSVTYHLSGFKLVKIKIERPEDKTEGD